MLTLEGDGFAQVSQLPSVRKLLKDGPVLLPAKGRTAGRQALRERPLRLQHKDAVAMLRGEVRGLANTSNFAKEMKLFDVTVERLCRPSRSSLEGLVTPFVCLLFKPPPTLFVLARKANRKSKRSKNAKDGFDIAVEACFVMPGNLCRDSILCILQDDKPLHLAKVVTTRPMFMKGTKGVYETGIQLLDGPGRKWALRSLLPRWTTKATAPPNIRVVQLSVWFDAYGAVLTSKCIVKTKGLAARCARHPREELEVRDQRKRCDLCFNMVAPSRGVSCSQAHFLCNTCVEGYTASLDPSSLDRHDGGVPCYEPRCRGGPLANVESHVSQPAIDKLTALRTDRAARIAREDAEHRAREARQRERRQPAKTRAVIAARDFVENELLVLRCPNGHAFYDFDGCCALQCMICSVYFCAYCLERCQGSQSAHAHVARCRWNDGDDPLYSSEESYRRRTRQRQLAQLVQYLREEVQAEHLEAVREAIKPLVGDLRTGVAQAPPEEKTCAILSCAIM